MENAELYEILLFMMHYFSVTSVISVASLLSVAMILFEKTKPIYWFIVLSSWFVEWIPAGVYASKGRYGNDKK